jgi:hypothetical protein
VPTTRPDPPCGAGRLPSAVTGPTLTSGYGRDVEQDIHNQLGRDAKITVKLIRSTQTTVDAALNELVWRSSGLPEPLRDAAELLGERDGEACALLVRAVRRAAVPASPKDPRPYAPPDASRFNR